MDHDAKMREINKENERIMRELRDSFSETDDFPVNEPVRYITSEQPLGLSEDVFTNAIELAKTLREFCVEHNIPKDAIICGVAWDADTVSEKSYIDGKDIMKRMIRERLGL